jgi:serine/threonine protein kinase
MEEIEVKYYILNLINALKYLHGKGIVHKDIKPSNVYFNYFLFFENNITFFKKLSLKFDGNFYIYS